MLPDDLPDLTCNTDSFRSSLKSFLFMKGSVECIRGDAMVNVRWYKVMFELLLILTFRSCIPMIFRGKKFGCCWTCIFAVVADARPLKAK